MVVYTLEAPMPPLQIPGKSMLKLEAISPTTGAAITGVTVSDVAIFGIDRSAELGTLIAEEIPTWVPDEVVGLEE